MDKTESERYDYVINLRVRRDTKRFNQLMKLAEIYGIDPTTKLIDKLLDDSAEIARFRANEMHRIEQLKKEAEERRARLYQ